MKCLSLVVIAISGVLGVSATNAVNLTDLIPTATEFGMVTPGEGTGAVGPDAPGKFNIVGYYAGGGHWPDARKIVKEVPADFAQPTDKPYSSGQGDIFLVAGKPLSGVGLWVRTYNGYHWIEYDVPAGAKKVTGHVYFTDDVHGYTRGYRQEQNQNGWLIVTVDGKELLKKEFLRHKVGTGAGAKLLDLNVDLPSDARRIRFRLQTTGWGDGNNNVELVLHNVKIE